MRWAESTVRSRLVIVVLGFGLLVLIAAGVLKWIPELLASGGLKANERAQELGRTRTAVLAAFAGLIAVAGAVLTGMSYGLNRSGQITERFTRAIDQLGSSELDIRLGGIYALERIARDSKGDHPQVIEVLTAYVREHAPWPPKAVSASDAERRSDILIALSEAIQALEAIARGTEPNVRTTAPPPTRDVEANELADEIPTLPTDVQAVMSVLGRRISAYDRPGLRLDLRSSDLRRVRLSAAEAHLEGADLSHAHLEGADLSGVHLERADLIGAHLERAFLVHANLEGAELTGAFLEGAVLRGAHLERACLVDAGLEGAHLTGAHLEGAHLTRAHLEGADLREVHLEGTDLSEAYLEGTDLRGAQLGEANRRAAHRAAAILDDSPRASIDDAEKRPHG